MRKETVRLTIISMVPNLSIPLFMAMKLLLKTSLMVIASMLVVLPLLYFEKSSAQSIFAYRHSLNSINL